MISISEFEPTIPTHSPLGQLAVSDGLSDANSFAMALMALATKGIHPPKVTPKKPAKPQPSKLGRWLGDLFHGRLKLMAEKKMHVVETVSLGERRFVTILQVEGRKFLIGGSSSNVSMLASLDGSEDPAEMLKLRTVETERLQ
jgi:hypothetical protein